MHIVIRKYQLLQFLEPLQLRKVRMRDYVIKADILEANLLDRFLEITVVQHL